MDHEKGVNTSGKFSTILTLVHITRPIPVTPVTGDMDKRQYGREFS